MHLTRHKQRLSSGLDSKVETDSNGYIEEEGRSSSGVKGDQLGGMLVLTSSGLRRHDAGSARAGGKVKPDELRGSNASGSAAEAAFGLVGGIVKSMELRATQCRRSELHAQSKAASRSCGNLLAASLAKANGTQGQKKCDQLI